MAQDQYALPSSPTLPSNPTWEDLLGMYFSRENGIICPRNMLKEYTPRSEENVSVSIVRQFPYSPIIKQESDYGVPESEYTYSSSVEQPGFTMADRSLLSTPKHVSLEDSIDILPRIAPVLEPYSPLDNDCSAQTKPWSFNVIGLPEIVFEDIPHRPLPMKILRPRPQLFVTLRFHEKRPFLGVVELSGPAREYRLPIFTKIIPLHLMLNSGNYALKQPNNVTEIVRSSVILSPKKRHVSRYTLGQMSLLLSLQNYDISLVKVIENIIISLCDQLCGLKIGERSWSRSVPLSSRREIIDKVYTFAKLYFPSFSVEHIQIIIKRGAYTRTQDFLRRNRRREKKALEKSMKIM